MKRLADFVVDRHKAVIAVTLILTLICGGLALLVRVNTDLTEYLPDDSGMKTGMDVMDEEFPEVDDVYALRVMFRGLPEERRLPLREELAGIPYVDEVEYEAGDADYNRGDYTLFVVQTKYDFDTAEERAVERVLTEEFAGYEMVFVRDAIEPAEVPPVLILLALALMLAVLTVMSSSWLEPFLFLASLGIAVALNMGTNFFLGTISEVSASIGYLLQMILSLDYSIMLLTRYRQEPDVRENKYAAMKNALVHSFSSIAASAMTTVAGLLVLVFMRFKIGKDLGIVLAKGVFLSMLCSFVFLPGVIILCDRWLEKTAKKALSVKMNAIAAFSGRFRYAIVVFFILLFTGAALWQGQTEITFVLEDPDPVAEVFPEINSMVVLFDNADEARVAELTEQLKSNDHILSAASFSSTLGKPFTAAELSDELRDMDGMDPGDLDIDSLRMLYYYYYKGEETGAIDAGDFLGFIADDVAQNEMFSERLDAEIRDHLDMLSVFADAGRLTQARAAADLADILEMEASDVADILVYYFAERGGADPGTMTLPDFVGFIRNEVLSDEEYADLFDAETLDQIDTLATLTDRAEITQPKDAAGIADVLEMERGDADLLLLYYYAKQGAADGVALTFPEFTRLLLDDCFNDERFAGAIDEETRRDAEKLEVLADPEEFRRREPMDAIAGKLDMDSGQAGLLAALYFAGEGAADDYALTVPEFIATVLEDILNDGRFAGSFTEDEREDMERLAVFADPEDFGRPENLTALAGKLGMDGDQAKLLAALYFAGAGEMDRETLTLERFVRVLVEQMMEDERMARFFDDETRDSMEDLRFFCSRDDVLARYSAGEAADRLGIPAETARLLFAYYYAANQTVTPGNIPLGEFVRFLTDIGGDANFAGMFGEEQQAQMALLAMFTDPGVLLAEYGPADMGRTLAGLGMAQASVDAVYAMTAADVMTLSDFMDILAQAGEGAAAAARAQAWEGAAMTAAGAQAGEGAAAAIAAAQDEGTSASPDPAAAQLVMLKNIKDAALSGRGLSPAEAAEVMGMDVSQAGFLYVCHRVFEPGYRGPDVGFYDLIRFIAEDGAGLTDAGGGSGLGGAAGQMSSLLDLMNGALDEEEYTPRDMALLLGGMAGSAAGSAGSADSGTGTGAGTGTGTETGAGTDPGASAPAPAAALDEDMVKVVYAYRLAREGLMEGRRLSVEELVRYVLDDLAVGAYSSSLNREDLAGLETARALMEGTSSGRRYTPREMSALVDEMDEDAVKMIFAYRLEQSGALKNRRLSAQDIVYYVLDDLARGQFSDSVNAEDLDDLETARALMDGVLAGTRYTPDQLAGLVGMEPDMLRILYAYRISLYGDTGAWKLSLAELVDFALNDLARDEDFGDTFDPGTLEDLERLRRIMAGALAGTAYRTEALAELLEMEADVPVKLYLLNRRRHGDISHWQVSLRDLVRFISEEVLTDEDLAGRIDAADTERLDAADRLTAAVVAGAQYDAGDMTRLFDGMSEDLSGDRMRLLYVYYFSRRDSDPAWTLSLLDLFNFLAEDVLRDPLFADVFDAEMTDQILDAKAEMDDGVVQLQGPNFSRLVIETDYPLDSPETYAFIGGLLAECGADLRGSYYLIGNSAMNYEMSAAFGDEQTFLTILTAVTIFIVVAVTFRSLLVPALLVLIIQCGVYLTVCLIGLQGYSIYYLAFLVVQSILMGATIDYGILFTNYYVENRRTQGPREALAAAYNGAVHTILTSGLIMILATGILGILFENPTVGEICQTISRGALCASLLIVFVLPGVLSVFDRWICK